MITMQDIAEKANVSKGTVSYVLSGKHKKARISAKTCVKIIEIADKLGYRRNAIARSMKTGKTNIIGILGGLYSSYCMDIIKGINSVVLKNDYMIKLIPLESLEEIKKASRQCVEQRLSGIICRSLTEEALEALRSELEPHKIPVVLVDSSFYHDWCSRVISDDFNGAKVATECLKELGHSKIGYITNNLSKGFAKVRYDGYMEVMKNHNSAVLSGSVCEISDVDYSISDLFREKIIHFIKTFKPTAIFCGSDIIAMKLIVVASKLGMKIPEDLSIIGYAGFEVSEITNPPLTTVRQDFKAMGEIAAELLFDEISGIQGNRQIRVPVELILRESTMRLERDKQ